jgi:hypothetical protein
VWNGSAWEDLAVVSGEVFVHFVNSFGTTKYYRVRAVDFSDNASSYTSSVSAETDFVDNDAFEQGIVDFFESQGAYAIQNGSTLPTGYGASDAGVLFFLTTDSKLYRWTGSAWTDAVVDLGDQAGQITETQITNDAITAPKLAANSVVTASMAAGTIDADRILANTITGGLLFSSGIITQVAQIGDGLITNAKIDNLAVDTAKIVDAAVETIKIDGNAVTVPVGKRASLPFSKTIFASSTSWAEVDSGVFVTWQTNDDDIPQAIIANASCSISGTSGDGSFQLRIRAKWSSTGAILGSINKRVRNDEANSAAVSGFLEMPSGWTGSVDNSIEIVIEAFCGSSNRVINDYALNVSGAKR